MNSTKKLGLGIAALCILSMAIPLSLTNSPVAMATPTNWFQMSVNAPINGSHIEVLEGAINATYDTTDAFDGLNLVQLQIFPTYDTDTGNRHDTALVMDMDGNVVNAYQHGPPRLSRQAARLACSRTSASSR